MEWLLELNRSLDYIEEQLEGNMQRGKRQKSHDARHIIISASFPILQG